MRVAEAAGRAEADDLEAKVTELGTAQECEWRVAQRLDVAVHLMRTLHTALCALR